MSKSQTITRVLPDNKLCESAPTLLSWMTSRLSEQSTWDEVTVLATLATAQSADGADIATWLRRLGVPAPSQQLQRSLACIAAALLYGGFPVSRDIGDLCRANPAMDVERRTTTH